MKRVKTRGATPPLYREVRVSDLDQVHGGTIVVSDPGGGGDGGGPKVTGGTDTGVVVIGGPGPGSTGPNEYDINDNK